MALLDKISDIMRKPRRRLLSVLNISCSENTLTCEPVRQVICVNTKPSICVSFGGVIDWFPKHVSVNSCRDHFTYFILLHYFSVHPDNQRLRTRAIKIMQLLLFLCFFNCKSKQCWLGENVRLAQSLDQGHRRWCDCVKLSWSYHHPKLDTFRFNRQGQR